ncbi:MAG: hemerythrin domain-containing protein [Deltaproteobacteria bacterium]|nr:hemerythrin domain-containing protein [Deltaproteobacteria bacterium]
MLDEIRRRVLDDHGALRDEMEGLAELVKRAGAAEGRLPEDLVDAARTFAEQVRAHLEYEEQVLIPALRESTNWGKVNTGDVRRYHGEQEASLARLAPLLEDAAVGLPRFVAALRGVMELVVEDMKHEEADLLVPKMLSDDPVGIDVSDG